jgi:hypothetical protein
VELLARLNPKTQSYDSISAGTANTALSGLDIAAALSMAKLRPLAYHYARAKYALDEQSRIQLFKCLVNVVKRKWGDQRAEMLAYMTITRNIDSNRCRKCNGTGYNRLAKPCKKCGGSGIYIPSAAENARVMGISQQAYSKTWAERVTEMDRVMTLTDQQVQSGVRWALREPKADAT